METINSFKGYDKVEPGQEAEFKRKSRRRCLVLGVSFAVLIAVIIGTAVGVTSHKKKTDSHSGDGGNLSPAATLKSICSVTLHPDSCFSSISAMEKSNTSDPETLFQLSLQVVMENLSKVKDLPKKLSVEANDNISKSALNVCTTVLDDAIDSLSDTLSTVNGSSGRKVLSKSTIDDLKTWLSSVITNQQTCIDSLKETNSTNGILEALQTATKNSTEFASNSLAIVTKFLSTLSKFDLPNNRKLLGYQMDGRYPEWLSSGDRKLLQSNPTPDVTVDAGGTGDVTTIGAAVAKIPEKSTKRFVIYVKAGTYKERINLSKKLWNVMIYGDGMGKTVITAAVSIADGVTTFDTSTFAVTGNNFIAKGITFRNTAGAAKHQAVAFRSGSDMSAYYQCEFDAFQDTLYSHSNRQFYSDCVIAGTIDFIFGNAASVFQGCNILPRQPLPNQFNTITAQGKMDPNQNTGISIQKCSIKAKDAVTAKTYFGRPWKPYSVTVIMQSSVSSVVDPTGWISWVVGTDPPKTIFYGEYLNTGPGSGVSGRVKWSGYFPALSSAQAQKYTVGSLIQGSVWLDSALSPFTVGL